jgi:hypothetical protein
VDPSPSAPVVIGGDHMPVIVHKAYLWDSGGRGRELPPAGGSPAAASMIRGGLVFGSTNGLPFDVYPVRWNLRTGKASVFDEAPGGGFGAANRAGWAVVTVRDGLVRISSSGSIDRLVGPPSAYPVWRSVPWLSADGRSLVVNSATRPTTWRC